VGTLWQSCAKVGEAIEQPLGVVSGVGSGIGVLDWGPHPPPGEGDVWGVSHPLV